jgi:hypothetical protein
LILGLGIQAADATFDRMLQSNRTFAWCNEALRMGTRRSADLGYHPAGAVIRGVTEAEKRDR